jgi:hypothetical protein
MKHDNQIKHILLNSAEGTSADFTNAVMNKINDLRAAHSCHRPLVPNNLKRMFLIVFSAVVTAILGLCLILSFSDPRVISRLQNMELPDLNYSKILAYTIIFWVLFSLNALLRRMFNKERW